MQRQQTATCETLFLSAEDMARLVATEGLEACISAVAETVRSDFLRWEDFDKSARVACHSQDGVIELMPVADAQEFAFKYVNGHPRNGRFGLPTVMAFGALADVATGHPILLSELTLLTAIRTAATSVVAARALARPESRRLALIGNGAQSEFQAIAFHQLLGTDEIRLYDVDVAASEKLHRNLAEIGIESRICSSIAQAVSGADIVTTATADKTNATILTADLIEPGMHLNAVGGDCPGKTELDKAILTSSSVFVEFAPQTRIEGEIQQMPHDFPVTELWEVLAGSKIGRSQKHEVTLFDSVGFALEDYSALRRMHQLAEIHGIGEPLSLIPRLADPKDLYSLLRQDPKTGFTSAIAQQKNARLSVTNALDQANALEAS